jgi:tetrahydromethanopterin S-methyltransferase subunit E
MNKKVVLLILIPCIISFIPLYYFTLDYMSYLYWINHQRPCTCTEGNNGCFCGVDTGYFCKKYYETNNGKQFHDICTIHRFDGEYSGIQFISIVISIVPAMVFVSLLSAIYLKHRITIKK